MSQRKAFQEKGFLQWGIDCDLLLMTSMSLISLHNHATNNPAWITYLTGFTAVCAAAHYASSLYQDYSRARQAWQFYRANAVTPQNTAAPAPTRKSLGR